MSPTLWSIAAALIAVGLEYLYRVLPGPWWHYLWIWIPCSTVISYSIYTLVTQPGVPLFAALIIWSLAVIFTRVFVTIALLHDHVSPGNWAALACLLAARIAQVVWK